MESDELSDDEREIMIQYLMRVARILDIGDGVNFDPGSFKVMMDLLNCDLSYLVVLKSWYSRHRYDPNWTIFFQESGSGWLWCLYHDKNDKSIDRLENFLRGVAQSA